MKPVISVKNLSKCYLLNHLQGSFSLKEALAQGIKNSLKRVFNPFKTPSFEEKKEAFWALKNLSFEIQPAQRLGLLGRNGAGKSTLLKVLSRIVEPTEGKAVIRGRISSLLEVGTGFHPELTGRENIFLNGAVLGMGRREIHQKFDEIVAFAEVERFLDTPVKRFSSGMYMRLGFAIAAHLDPEVLIVDEVLAVGDRPFQEKCLKKMDELGKTGRTVLFVSHDVAAMRALCTHGLYLEQGAIKAFGTIDTCINAYLKTLQPQGLQWTGRMGDHQFEIKEVNLEPPADGRDFYVQGEEACVRIECDVRVPLEHQGIEVEIWDHKHQFLAHAITSEGSPHPVRFEKPGKYQLVLKFDSGSFHPGDYILKVQPIEHHSQIAATLKFPLYPRANSSLFGKSNAKGMLLSRHWDIHRRN